VSNGGQLLTVVDVRTLELAGQVGVDVASQLKTGMSVEFTVESRPDQSYSGRVARIDPEADPGTRQIGVYVQLPNASRELTAGQYATGRVLLGTPRALVVVPSVAVRLRDGKSMVAVVADGQIRLQEVTIGTRDEARGLVGLSSGLEAGARILVMPGSGLDHGTQVRVVNTSTPNDSGRPPVAPVGEKN
jgi:RND family efflux transporter MFP subunit